MRKITSRKLVKVKKPTKVVGPQPNSNRCAARLFRIHPDPNKPRFTVEVRIARTRKLMFCDVLRVEGRPARCDDAMGMVFSFDSKVDKRDVVLPQQVVARMYLNAVDLFKLPGEIMAHECTHAAMAWARIQKANLKVMNGEEVLCYAVGRMLNQVNNIFYRLRAWRGK